MRVLALLAAFAAIGVAWAVHVTDDPEPEGRQGHPVRLTAQYDPTLDRRTNGPDPTGGANATAHAHIQFRFPNQQQAAFLAEHGESGDLPRPELVHNGSVVDATDPARKMVQLDAGGSAVLFLDATNDHVMALGFAAEPRTPPPGLCDANQDWMYYATRSVLHMVPVREAIGAGVVTVPFGAVCAGP